ncbi:MAG TPA: aminopeptidase [Anaerolineales bacterium]
MTAFQDSLKKYAKLIVHTGLNLQKGQPLIINNASTKGVPLHAAPLVREVTREAYESGAPYVEVLWNDEELIRLRAQYAPEGTFAEYSDWQIQALTHNIEKGGAMLTIRSNNPDLLNDLDSERVGVMQKTHLEKFNPVSMAVTGNKLNWLVVAAASPVWAMRVFPDLPAKKAEAKLWEAIFQITRVDQPDPVAAWEQHVRNLLKRGNYLTEKQYTALHYRAPGTDLKVGLPRGHRWISAREKAQNGIEFIANLPTEEVFTLPHRMQTEGTVKASMPLSYGGTLIENFSMTFEQGRVVRASASKGEAILNKIIGTDEGAGRLGEAALVPMNSPIASRGHLFYDALIDENASCHLAIGRAYRINLDGAQDLSDDEFRHKGGNTSLTHVDFMVGSNEMDIDGLREDGSTEPVFRKGKWAFEV